MALPALAVAQTIPKEKGPVRTVGLFNFLCLKQLPDLNGIERAAGFGEFDQITGDDLKPYAPQVPPEKLFAWRYHDHGDEFVLVAAQSKPDDAFSVIGLLVTAIFILTVLQRVFNGPLNAKWSTLPDLTTRTPDLVRTDATTNTGNRAAAPAT